MKPSERDRRVAGLIGVFCLLSAGGNAAALVALLLAGPTSPLLAALHVFFIAILATVGRWARYLWRPREYYQACRRDLIREHQRLRRYAASNQAGFQALYEAMDRLAESGR